MMPKYRINETSNIHARRKHYLCYIYSRPLPTWWVVKLLRIAGINTKNKRRIAGMLSLASQALLVWILYLSDHNFEIIHSIFDDRFQLHHSSNHPYLINPSYRIPHSQIKRKISKTRQERSHCRSLQINYSFFIINKLIIVHSKSVLEKQIK